MVLSPFEPAAFGPVAALIPPRIPEPPVAARSPQELAAVQFALADARGPLMPDHGNARLIRNAEGEPRILVLPSRDPAADRLLVDLLISTVAVVCDQPSGLPAAAAE